MTQVAQPVVLHYDLRAVSITGRRKGYGGGKQQLQLLRVLKTECEKEAASGLSAESSIPVSSRTWYIFTCDVVTFLVGELSYLYNRPEKIVQV